MVHNRRNFVKKLAVAGSTLSVNNLLETTYGADLTAANRRVQHLSPLEIVADEDYWHTIGHNQTNRADFRHSTYYPNLAQRKVQRIRARFN